MDNNESFSSLQSLLLAYRQQETTDTDFIILVIRSHSLCSRPMLLFPRAISLFQTVNPLCPGGGGGPRFTASLLPLSVGLDSTRRPCFIPLLRNGNELGRVRLCDCEVEGRLELITDVDRTGAGTCRRWREMGRTNCHASSIQTGVMDSTSRSSPQPV